MQVCPKVHHTRRVHVCTCSFSQFVFGLLLVEQQKPLLRVPKELFTGNLSILSFVPAMAVVLSHREPHHIVLQHRSDESELAVSSLPDCSNPNWICRCVDFGHFRNSLRGEDQCSFRLFLHTGASLGASMCQAIAGGRKPLGVREVRG